MLSHLRLQGPFKTCGDLRQRILRLSPRKQLERTSVLRIGWLIGTFADDTDREREVVYIDRLRDSMTACKYEQN